MKKRSPVVLLVVLLLVAAVPIALAWRAAPARAAGNTRTPT